MRMTKLNVIKLAEEVKEEVALGINENASVKEIERTWDARFDWVTNEKEVGNTMYKEKQYDQAIDQYLRAYCGIVGFSDKQKKED